MGKRQTFRKAWRRASLRRTMERQGFAPDDALRLTDWMESPTWDNAPYILDLESGTVVWDKPGDVTVRPYNPSGPYA